MAWRNEVIFMASQSRTARLKSRNRSSSMGIISFMRSSIIIATSLLGTDRSYCPFSAGTAFRYPDMTMRLYRGTSLVLIEAYLSDDVRSVLREPPSTNPRILEKLLPLMRPSIHLSTVSPPELTQYDDDLKPLMM